MERAEKKKDKIEAAYKFSQLAYTPSDYEKINQKLESLTKKITEAKRVEDVIAGIEESETLMDQVSYSYNLAFIRSSLDCTDEFYQDAIQKEGAGISMLQTAPFHKALLDSPFLPELEKRYGTEFRPVLEQNFQTKVGGHELMAKEQVLVSQYQQKKASLQVKFRGKQYSEGEMFVFFDDPNRQTRLDARKALAQAVLEQKETFAPMLTELISLRDQIAKENGFENYLEYANASYSRRGYGEAEMTAFCQQVKEELVPLLSELREEQRKRLGVEKLMSYDEHIYFADGNAAPAGDAAFLTEQSKKMYDALSPELGTFFKAMVESESLDVAPSVHKVAGMGFCTDVSREYLPYVFGNCNGTDTDVEVFTHEIGHAWQGYLTKKQVDLDLLQQMPLDAVEIPSKTMELFTYPYAENFFGKDAAKFRQGHFIGALREIASYCSIHEFNTWIYTHVGASFEELTEKQIEIEKLYHPELDYGEMEPYVLQGCDLMRSMAVYMFPRYVISYALSEMCAMDLFRQMKEDPAAAWAAYGKLCSVGGSLSYPDILAGAGLEPAYAKNRVGKVVTFAREYIKTELEK
ncbi:MAG: M3 family oligoendopeptidase [Lachnospiraceae bacterium]